MSTKTLSLRESSKTGIAVIHILGSKSTSIIGSSMQLALLNSFGNVYSLLMTSNDLIRLDKLQLDFHTESITCTSKHGNVWKLLLPRFGSWFSRTLAQTRQKGDMAEIRWKGDKVLHWRKVYNSSYGFGEFVQGRFLLSKYGNKTTVLCIDWHATTAEQIRINFRFWW